MLMLCTETDHLLSLPPLIYDPTVGFKFTFILLMKECSRSLPLSVRIQAGHLKLLKMSSGVVWN